MGTKLDKTIGSRVRHFRTAAGLRRMELAEAVGCQLSTIYHSEYGKSRLSISLLSKIADYLKVDLYKFFTDREIDPDQKTIEALVSLLNKADNMQLAIIYNVVSDILDLT